MNLLKDEIMNFMKEQKIIQSHMLKSKYKDKADYDRALSSLIDDNKLEEKHVSGIKMVRLGMAV